MHLTRSHRHGPWLPGVLALLIGAAGHAGAQVQPRAPERHNPLRATYARAHFYQAMLLHDAVARGDLDAARLEATHLSQSATAIVMPAGAAAFQAALTHLAQRASTAATLHEAAQTSAAILGTCGQCHQAMHTRAILPAGDAITTGGLAGHMQLHQHGSDALIEGLVAPSDAAWAEGVRTFAAPSLAEHEAPGDLRKEMSAGEAKLSQLAGEAAQARRSRDRETAYGRILATCGECHRTVSRHARPGRR